MKKEGYISSALKKLAERIASLTVIDPKLIFKNGLALENGKDIHKRLTNNIESYNLDVKRLAEKRKLITAIEKEATDFAKNSLNAVKNDFGDDSTQYETAGGTRVSMRAKPVRKPKPPIAKF